MTIDEAKQPDYYHLFPDCAKCHQLRLNLNCVTSPYTEELAEGAYSRHLLQDHKLTRIEILDKTGVFIY